MLSQKIPLNSTADSLHRNNQTRVFDIPLSIDVIWYDNHTIRSNGLSELR